MRRPVRLALVAAALGGCLASQDLPNVPMTDWIRASGAGQWWDLILGGSAGLACPVVIQTPNPADGPRPVTWRLMPDSGSSWTGISNLDRQADTISLLLDRSPAGGPRIHIVLSRVEPGSSEKLLSGQYDAEGCGPGSARGAAYLVHRVGPTATRPPFSPGTTAVIVLRLDDGRTSDRAVIPLLEARGLVAEFGMVAGYPGRDFALSWEEIQQLQAHGHEIAAHSFAHGPLPKTPVDWWREIVLTRDVFAQHGIFPTTFITPGSWTRPGGSPYFTDADSLFDFGIQLLARNYALVESYRWSSAATPFPWRVDASVGLAHVTLETTTLANALRDLDTRVRYRGGAVYLLHSWRLDTGDGWTTATYKEFLDSVVARRDRGLVRVATAAQLLLEMRSAP